MAGRPAPRLGAAAPGPARSPPAGDLLRWVVVWPGPATRCGPTSDRSAVVRAAGRLIATMVAAAPDRGCRPRARAVASTATTGRRAGSWPATLSRSAWQPPSEARS